MITAEQLRTTFVSPAMKHYFDRKLAPLDSAEVDIRIEELLKYLNLAQYSQGGIPFSIEIDDVWHLWILQTKEYRGLCQKLQGGKFIHHSSNDYDDFLDPDVRSRPIDLLRAVGLLASYVLNYGPFEPRRAAHWPVVLRLAEGLGWSLDQFNTWLASVPGPGVADSAGTSAGISIDIGAGTNPGFNSSTSAARAVELAA